MLAACGGDDSAATRDPRRRADHRLDRHGSAPARHDRHGVGTTRRRATATATSTAGASCAEIPEETAGPYPGDGSNGPNVLTESGVVRSDIRSSIGSASGVAEGVPLTVELTVTDTAAGCVPLAGAAVYLWHCDREGRYSMYSQGVENENYLRGVQETDADGKVTFVSIFPACYPGRWPHIHFEVYAASTRPPATGDPIATSQLAFPEDVCNVVYATDGYSQSVEQPGPGLAGERHGVRRRRRASSWPPITGSVESGYTAALAVPV